MQEPSYKKILIIDHDAKGCSNNLLALATAFRLRDADIQVEIIKSELRSKALLPLLRLTLTKSMRARLAGNGHVKKSFYHFFFTGDYPQDAQYDEVLSTLGPGEAPGAFITYHWQSRSIHIGTPRRLPKHYFDIIIANPGIAPKPGEIELELPPTRLMPEMLARDGAGIKNRHHGAPLYTLLIGGPAADVHYTDAVWDNLFFFMDRLAEKEGCRWLVSTSPRTPASICARLRDMAQSGTIAELSVFTGAKTDVSQLPQLIGAADKIFVTAESVSMLGDALAAGVPVFGLSAPGLIDNPRINGFLSRQTAHGNFPVIALTGQDSDLPLPAPAAVLPHWTDYFWRHLAQKGNILS